MKLRAVGGNVVAGLAACARAAPGFAAPFLASSPSALPTTLSSSSSPPLRKRADKRPVFAHVVQGDFQSYSEDDYAADFAMAKEAGIVAFAMNVGNDATDSAQLTKAFSAASKTSFSLFFSFDMNYFNRPESSFVILNNYLKPFGSSPAHFLWEGKVLVSTFSGETSGTWIDGAGSFEESNEKWKALLDSAAKELGKEIAYVPDWNDVATVPSQTYGGGIMSWAAWGDRGRTTEMTTAGDESYIAAASAAGLWYMAPVAAFFFVHVAAGNNYVHQSNDFLLPRHYEDLINLHPGPAAIELLSWNDYGEAHYLGPVRESAGIPGLSSKYVDKTRDHTPMLCLSAYYNLWFTNGSPPTIKSECIIWYHRPHPAGATASSDELDKPEYANTLDDKIFAVVFVPKGSSAVKLVITTDGQATDGQEVKEGVNLVSADFVAGATGVSLQDSSGKELIAGTGVEITGSPATYDFNFYSYIVPEGFTASSFLDGVHASSSSESNADGGTATSTKADQATARGGKDGDPSSASDTPSSSSSTAPPARTSAGSSGSTGSQEAGSSEGDSSSSSSSPSSSSGGGFLGFPLWGWIAGGAALLVLAVGAFFLASRRSESGKKEEGRKLVASSDAEDSEQEDSGAEEDSSDGGGEQSTARRR